MTMDFGPAALMGYDEDDLPAGNEQQMLAEILRRREAQEAEERNLLQGNLAQQQGDSGRLRSLAMLTSMGQNPLLRGLQREASQQGQQADARASQTAGRLAQVGAGGMDPMAGLIRLREMGLAKERLKQQGALGYGNLDVARGRLGLARDTAGTKAVDDAVDRETSLRKEVNSLPEVKEFKALDASYQTLKQVAADPSGPAGVTTIFSFMKMLDPGVSVMEGDVNLIRSSGGPAARYANIYESALTGNPLPESVRKDILRQAETIYQTKRQTYERAVKRYQGLATAAKVEPSRVVQVDDMPSGGGPATRGPASPTTAPAGGAVRVLINGKPLPRPVPREKLEGLRKAATSRGDTLEVQDG